MGFQKDYFVKESIFFYFSNDLHILFVQSSTMCDGDKPTPKCFILLIHFDSFVIYLWIKPLTKAIVCPSISEWLGGVTLPTRATNPSKTLSISWRINVASGVMVEMLAFQPAKNRTIRGRIQCTHNFTELKWSNVRLLDIYIIYTNFRHWHFQSEHPAACFYLQKPIRVELFLNSVSGALLSCV